MKRFTLLPTGVKSDSCLAISVSSSGVAIVSSSILASNPSVCLAFDLTVFPVEDLYIEDTNIGMENAINWTLVLLESPITGLDRLQPPQITELGLEEEIGWQSVSLNDRKLQNAKQA